MAPDLRPPTSWEEPLWWSNKKIERRLGSIGTSAALGAPLGVSWEVSELPLVGPPFRQHCSSGEAIDGAPQVLKHVDKFLVVEKKLASAARALEAQGIFQPGDFLKIRFSAFRADNGPIVGVVEHGLFLEVPELQRPGPFGRAQSRPVRCCIRGIRMSVRCVVDLSKRSRKRRPWP